jgi:hypothetical protein
MIEYDLDTEHSILLVRPESALDKNDFAGPSKAHQKGRTGHRLAPPGCGRASGIALCVSQDPHFPAGQIEQARQ